MRILAVLFTLCIAQLAHAVDHNAALKDYLTDDVVAIAYVDLSSIDTLGVLEWAVELGVVSNEERGDAAKFALEAQQRLDEIVDFGASYVYLLFRVSDISHRGPSWVVPVARDGDPRSVLSLIRSGQPGQGDADAAVQPSWLPEFWETAGDVILGGNTEAQLEKLKSTRPKHERDLSDAWEALGQGDCGLVIFGDADSRRVVHEMFPPLPEPFAALNGELIAAGLPWGGVAIKLPPEPQAELTIEAQDNQTAQIVEQLIAGGIDLLKGLPLAQRLFTEADRKMLFGAFAPKLEGTQVRITLDQPTSNTGLIQLVSPPIRAARQAAQRRQRMNQFKQIAVAFLNYHDSKDDAFPAQANYDDTGKPLLSWRVLVLLYLDQGALYNQFNLDEPWDSAHNRQLIDKMPEIYADPNPTLRRINAEGKTTFVVPVGDGTVFDNPAGTPIKEVTDGTSNTIMLVEVVPERAVVWTKPEDWQVNFSDPLNGVKRSDRNTFTVSLCDGSVNLISDAIDESAFRALLTKAGAEAAQ